MIETLAEAPAPRSSRIASLLLSVLTSALRPILVVGVALLIGMGVILYTRQNPFVAYQNLLIAPFLSWDTFSAVLFFAIPLVLTGLATTVSFRANLFNIGGEGQLQVGALTTAFVALSLSSLPAVLLVPIVLLAGALAGALWSSIAGWLRASMGASELVSTIMLNYVAIDLVSYMVAPGGPLAGGGSATKTIPGAAQFQTFGTTQLHWGFLVALLGVVLVFLLLYRTPLGYEIRMIGANAPFALYGGVAVPWVILAVSLITGALAGAAGAVQVMGFQHQYSTAFISAQWGFTGVTVALLARLEPVGVVVAAILYALLEEGDQLMENNTSVDHNIITVVQGLIILFVTAQIAFRWYRGRRMLPAAQPA
ncbi:MAG: ABC transporter permease [Chloroflexota bacterium]|nr:ABC transporter permease [Chloroflexota bacterium]